MHPPPMIIVMSSSVPEVAKYTKVEPLDSPLNKRVYEEIMAEEGLQPEASLSLPSDSSDDGAHAETDGEDCKEEGQNCQLPATSSSVRSDAEQDISRLDLLDKKFDACMEQVIDALKNHAGAPKFAGLAPDEKAHNPSMTDVTRAELDAKFELLDTKLGTRIHQAVDAMQARDEVHKHALEKAQAEFVSRDALYAEIAKRQDLSTEKLKAEMAGRDAVYAEIAKRQELAAEKFREEMAGRDAVAAERARAHELTVQKALAEAAGREALMDQRLKSMDGELAKIGDSFKSVKANIWFGVATTASIIAAIVAVALAGFDSGRETSKAIAESTVKLEQLIKAQEAKAAAPATPSVATPSSAAKPKAPAGK
jgi:hypothetical protein